MDRLQIAVCDSVFPDLDPSRGVLSKIGGELFLAKEPAAEAILDVARTADAVLVTYAKVTAEMIQQMRRCKVISRFGIGVDNVDIAAATAAGIVVTRVPDYCIDEVSDHALALLMALARKVCSANAVVQAGRWEMPSVVPIHRLRGRILGLVGFGQIPQMLAPKAKALGLRIVAFDPFIPPSVMEGAGVKRAELFDLLKVSDYISIHVPLNSKTHHLFDECAFDQMKPTSFLINTARGPIVDEAALADALDQGKLAGAALDVLEKEPPIGSRLTGRANVILTPHIGFYSEESLVELQIKAAEEIVRVLSGEAPHHAVNPEAFRLARSN